VGEGEWVCGLMAARFMGMGRKSRMPGNKCLIDIEDSQRRDNLKL
jgi:hypothetical protein